MSQQPPSQDPVELTRRAYERLNSGDFDALLGLFGSESMWDVSRWGLGTHVGPEAVGRFLDDWFGSLEDFEVQIEELEDLGGGVVYVVVVQVAHEGSGRGYLQLRSAPVFVWREGRIASLTIYPDADEGRAAAERAAELLRTEAGDEPARASPPHTAD
jgi:ketosteroid isomerase-like protein